MNEEELKKRLEMLRIEHRDLDAAIDALTAAGAVDQLQIARLKKRKLKPKDQMAMIEDYLIPDIIARLAPVPKRNSTEIARDIPGHPLGKPDRPCLSRSA